MENLLEQHETLIVGGGIDALMTAYMLKLKGPDSEIKLVTRNADPRRVARDKSEFYKDEDGKQLDGSTWKGLINRYVTLFEGHNYTEDTAAYPQMDYMFQHLISEGGWLGKELCDCTEEEIHWLAQRITACCVENTPFNRDLFELYVQYNQFAMNWWRQMRDEEPELFQDVDLVPGVARVYDNADLFEAAKTLHEKYDGLAKHHGALSANDPDDLEIIKDHYPHFHAAIRSGFIRGGVLHMDEEKSFTFNVQKFGENLINHLERAGVQLQFNTDMRSIKTNDEGDVVALYGVRTDGDVSYLYNVTGTNIIVSAGAYAGKLLEGTPVEHAINGVAGGWIVLPAPDGIQKSFKVHGDRYFISDDGAILRYDTLNKAEREALPPQTLRSVSDQNHKIIERDGKSYIVIGGGYAWVGSDPHSISKAQKETMKEENLRVARAVYGDHFDMAMAKGEVECWDNICVRSFSANDVPIISLGKTESGGRFVVIGGMNTGTTTAAPTTGTIVADLIDKSEGSTRYQKIIDDLDNAGHHSALDFFRRIQSLNHRWHQFITQGKGKSILEHHEATLKMMARDFRSHFGVKRVSN